MNYVARRILQAAVVIVLMSLLAFGIVRLPARGNLVRRLEALRQAGAVSDETIRRWEAHFGLDQPWTVQYVRWIKGIVARFDFGDTNAGGRVDSFIAVRMPLSLAVAFCATLLTWATAIPIGIFVAVKRYSIADYVVTFLGFIGLAVPGFMLAMVVMYYAHAWFGLKVGGLYSAEYRLEPWSWAKFLDLLQHLWVPALLIGIGGIATMVRTLRATMLDELRKPYVTVARAKGLSPLAVLVRYPLRLAINPIVSSTAWLLPYLFSGGIVVERVLNLSTAGPALLDALLGQDTNLAATYILITGTLTVIGSLLSDLLLAALDPRIRFGRVGKK